MNRSAHVTYQTNSDQHVKLIKLEKYNSSKQVKNIQFMKGLISYYNTVSFMPFLQIHYFYSGFRHLLMIDYHQCWKMTINFSKLYFNNSEYEILG